MWLFRGRRRISFHNITGSPFPPAREVVNNPYSVPELPDIVVYLEALAERVLDRPLERVELVSPFLLRTVDPPLIAVEGKTVKKLRRVGKRIAFGFDEGLWLVIHLMIAGRLHWFSKRPKTSGRNTLAALGFPNGWLTLTEAGSRRRASLHVVANLETVDPGGLEVLTAGAEAFGAALIRENHTLKRALTDPHLFSGIGNAYSDEILFRAKLSPLALTHALSKDEVARLHDATLQILDEWTGKLRDETAGKFPEKVTAFHEGMAVHGRFGLPCPVCGTKIQRIRYGPHETNYCVRCQTAGRLLADRFLSRLLKKDWPKTLEELEERKRAPSAQL
jgi:formamidopyrimidine-DNA glycosylase